MKIKAISTNYSGHLFRSRLEARWAVFFDHMGVRWEYEPEGYELSDGLWYLPDFYLPEYKCWVEVKPDRVPDSDLTKPETLARDIGQLVLIAAGAPHEWHGFRVFGNHDYSCLSDRHYCALAPRGEIRFNDDPRWQDCAGTTFPENHHSAFLDAVRAANSARFEHGRKGN